MAMVIPVVVIGAQELLAAAALAGGALAAAFAWRSASESKGTSAVRSKASSNGRRKGCPPHDWFKGKDIDHLADALGITRIQVRKNIHSIKDQLEGNPDVSICKRCGDVASPKSGDIIGNLRDG